MRRKFLFIFVLAFLLGACAQQTIQPEAASESENDVPRAEGVKLEVPVSEYQVRVDGEYGILLPVDLPGRNVFLSDYPVDLNFSMTGELELVLATPNDELYFLEEVPDLDEIIAEMGEEALTGAFSAGELPNLAYCDIPGDIQPGEDNAYCGFQFIDEGETYIVLVFGTTIRDLENPQEAPTRIPAAPSP